MNIPREFIDLLLAKIDLVDLINTYLPLQKKSGSNYFARCPFHQEKSASFSVSQPKQFYYCFGCGAHGNAIDFIMQHDRLSFPEAIEALGRQYGMEIPQTAKNSPKKDAHLPALYALMVKASDYYYDQMRHSQRAIHYLKQRGISGVIAQQFALGYALPGWNHVLEAFGKDELERLLAVGLIIKKEEGGHYDRFRDRIMFPIHDYRGRIIGFGGRVLDQGEPKYLNSPETTLFQKGHELYGLYQALKMHRSLNQVVIVEGYMDVIALFQHGITYAAATLGTATTTNHIRRLLRYTSDIVFCFDGDQAGRTAAWRALQTVFPLMNDQLQVRFLFLPEGEDPDSLVRKEGKPSFEKRLTNALSLSDFFFHTLSQQSDLNTMEGRARFAAQALQFIKQLPAGIFQEMMLEALSKRARVDNTALHQQLKHSEGILSSAPPAASAAPTFPAAKLTAPLRLLTAFLVQNPSLVRLITLPLAKTILESQSIVRQLLEIIHKNPQITTGALLEHWRGSADEAFITTMASLEHMVPEAGVEKEFLGALRQLMALHYEENIHLLLAKAAQLALTDLEKQELSRLIAEKKALVTMIS